MAQQATQNSKQQFETSTYLKDAFFNTIIDDMETHIEMRKQALGSEFIQAGLLESLMGPGQLYERLRDRAR